MKENWTYKKLGEVCKTTSGGTPSKDHSEYYEGGTIPWLRSGEVSNRNITKTELFITQNGVDNSSAKLIPQNSVVIAMYGATVGQVGILRIKATTNQAVCSVLPNDCFVPEFLYYALLSHQKSYMELAVGGAQPNISQQIIKNTLIPVPPIETQFRIVSELDLLQSIIDKQKAQPKELDNLAQAVFYDMFGDPVENDKGWEVKKLGEVGELQRGSGLSKKDLIEDGFPCMLYGQIHTRFGAYTKKHIACIPKELVKTTKIAHPGDVIMAITSEDVEGSCKSVAWMGDYDIAIGSDAAIYRHSMNGIYVSYYTQTKAFYNEKAKYAKGFKVTHISTKEIASISIPVPPLSLQQSFAAKIESIEKQRAAITQSIAETQRLFDYTMDKYFG